jgi:hypothetical protein
MYAQIFAKGGDNKFSSGKTTAMAVDDYELMVKTSSVEMLAPGGPKRYLEIKASETYCYNGKDVDRDLLLELYEKDLAKIFHFALKHGLFGANMKSKIRSSYEHLSELAAVMKVRLPSRSRKKKRPRD